MSLYVSRLSSVLHSSCRCRRNSKSICAVESVADDAAPPPSSSSEEAAERARAGVGGPADKKETVMCSTARSLIGADVAAVAGVALSNSFPWVFATGAPVLY